MTTEARTGPLVRELANGVRDDLGEIAQDFIRLRTKIETLGDSARAINGLGNACSGWADHINTILTEVQKEQREVPAKLLGQPIHEIVATVNADHAEAVSAARRKAS